MTGATGTTPPTVLVAHPGAELFGSDRMALESVIGFLDAGARVIVTLPEPGPLAEKLIRAGAQVEYVPMLVLRKALLKPRNWGLFAALIVKGTGSALRLLRHYKPQSVYVSTVTIPQWPLLARLFRARVVSHVHEAEASGSRIVNLALYLPHLAAHSVIVNSRFSLETLRKALPLLAKRAHVVYNGVAGPEHPSPPRPELTGPLRIVYVGRLSPRKGPDLILDAAEILARSGIATDIDLVGSVFTGYEWFESELRSKATALPPSVRVTFTGFVEDVWSHIDAADVMVVPSRLDEPFGNTAVEGILARRPVIASDTSGLREAAGSFESATLVTPGSADELATNLRRLQNSWSSVARSTDASRAAASLRHAPPTYRADVSATVTPP